MNTPQRADIQLYNDLVEKINLIVEASNNEPEQVQLLVRRQHKEIDGLQSELGGQFYFILKGILAGLERRESDVHHYFSSALDVNPTIMVYIQYIKTLINCSAHKPAYELAYSVYEMDGTNPEIYSLIGESAMHLGLLKTSLEWIDRYEKMAHKTHQFREQLEGMVRLLPNVDESAISSYMDSAVKFMSERGVRRLSQSFKTISADSDVLEVFFYADLSSEVASETFYDFVTSDYILDVPDEILDSVTINFAPYVS